MATIKEENVLIMLSGEDRSSLLATISYLLNQLKDTPEASKNFTSPVKTERLAILAPRSELVERLQLAQKRLTELKRNRLFIRDKGIFFGCGETAGKIAFLFPGQGSQHTGMLHQLYEKIPIVKTWFDTLDQVHKQTSEPPPSHMIFHPPSTTGQEQKQYEQDLFDIGRGAQLGTVANLALYQILCHMTIKPDFVLGHSNGEHTAVLAACADLDSNRIQICDWLRRASRAGYNFGKPQVDEKMLAVTAIELDSLKKVVGKYQERLFIAMDNCPHQQVIAGEQIAVDQASKEIVAIGGACGVLPFTRAYHTPFFTEWSKMLRSYYNELPLKAPNVSIFSSLTVATMPANIITIRDLMAGQWTALVRFRESIETLYRDGVRTFIEVGPNSKLTGFVEDTLRSRPHLAVSTSSIHRGDLLQLQHLTASLHAHGITVDQNQFNSLLQIPNRYNNPSLSITKSLDIATTVHSELISDAIASRRRMEELFQHVVSKVSNRRDTEITKKLPLLGENLEDTYGQLTTQRLFSRQKDPFLIDHSLGRSHTEKHGFSLPVIPFTASLEIVAEAAYKIEPYHTVEISEVRANRWLALDGGNLTVTTKAVKQKSGVYISLFDSSSNIATPAFEAVAFFRQLPQPQTLPPHLTSYIPKLWTVEDFYKRYAFHGASFQTISRILSVSNDVIEAELKVTKLPGLETESLQLNPAILDAAGQLVAFWLLEAKEKQANFGIFPFAAKRVTIYQSTLSQGSKVYCRCNINYYSEIKTEASFTFFLSNGHVIASIEFLQQRFIELPPNIAKLIFNNIHISFSQVLISDENRVACRISPSDWNLLTESWEIWHRAIAHILLNSQELNKWLSLQPSSRFIWFLEKLVAKEAICHLLKQKGYHLADLREIFIDESRNICCNHTIELHLNVTNEEDGSIVATVW